MTLTRYGLREWGGCGLIAIVLLFGCYLLARINLALGLLPAIVVIAAYGALAFFFRSPHRTPPENEEFILSPADGVVRDITIVNDFDQLPFEGKALRIGIFLSVLNVHVNRAPVKMQVITKHYRPGKYLDARSSECVKENEAMTIAGHGEAAGETFPVAVRQISGAIARRIVCQVEPGCKLGKGKIYGMIKFGSRTELYVPADDRFELMVKPGMKVKSGISVLMRLHGAGDGFAGEEKSFFESFSMKKLPELPSGKREEVYSSKQSASSTDAADDFYGNRSSRRDDRDRDSERSRSNNRERYSEDNKSDRYERRTYDSRYDRDDRYERDDRYDREDRYDRDARDDRRERYDRDDEKYQILPAEDSDDNRDNRKRNSGNENFY